MKFGELVNSDTPTLIDFYATWCGPCKVMSPLLDELKAEIGDEAKVVKIDIDRNQPIAQHFQVRSVPTLMIFKNGEVVWRHSGLMPVNQLKETLLQFSTKKA